MIEYRPIEDADIPTIVRLYAENLNDGQAYADLIQRSWEAGEYFGLCAVEDGVLQGFMSMRPGIAFTYPHPEIEAELAELVGEEPVANCDALIVLPVSRHNGLAHKLAKKVREILLEQGYRYYLAEIWIYPDGTAPAKNTFESVGKVVFERRCDMFYRDLAQYGMSCPVCGPDCICGAWVEVMDMKEPAPAQAQ